MTLPESSTLGDVRDAIERECMWVFDGHDFVRFAGGDLNQLSNDVAISIGRPRVMDRLSIRFVSVSGSVGISEVSAGVTLFEYGGIAPDGQPSSIAKNSERSFTEGTQGAVGQTGVINTTRKSVTSGVNYDGRVSLMPGGFARIAGTLTVASFVGRGLDRNQTAVPLQVDLRRGRWTAVHMFTGFDAAAAFGFNGEGFDGRLGGERIRVDVRVE